MGYGVGRGTGAIHFSAGTGCAGTSGAGIGPLVAYCAPKNRCSRRDEWLPPLPCTPAAAPFEYCSQRRPQPHTRRRATRSASALLCVMGRYLALRYLGLVGTAVGVRPTRHHVMRLCVQRHIRDAREEGQNQGLSIRWGTGRQLRTLRACVSCPVPQTSSSMLPGCRQAARSVSSGSSSHRHAVMRVAACQPYCGGHQRDMPPMCSLVPGMPV